MKTLFIAAVIFCILIGSARAQEFEESVALKVIGTGLMVADCAQTYNMMKKPHIYYEMNPLLGQHPSPQKILWACAGTITAAHLIDHFLGPKWSNTGWAVIIALELHAVHNNYGVIKGGREYERSLPGLGMSLYRTQTEQFSVVVPFDQPGAMLQFKVRF